jgi:sarcosine oxidase delta subunit
MKTLLISLAALATIQPCLAAPDAAKYIVERGWTAYDSKVRFTMPAADIVPLLYYSKGSKVPSCGLLSGPAGAPRFIDILSAEAGEDYPHCPAINDAAAFKLGGKDYLVFSYTNRDSRDESYGQFFYIYKNKTGEYLADEQLNNSAGSSKSGAKATDGIRLARISAIKQGQPGMELQSRDLVADGAGAFAVFKDKASANCTFVVDNGIELSKYSSELFAERGKCMNYLASSKLDTPAKTYYLGMFKSSDAMIRIAVFSVMKNTAAVRAEKELAQSAAGTGKIIDIKSLKAFLIEPERK